MEDQNQRDYGIKAWIIWLCAALFAMYQFAMQGSPSVMIANLTCDLEIDIRQVAVITSFFFYTYILFQIPGGILVDSFGPKILLIIASILLGAFCVIFSCCQTLGMIKLSRLLMGFASAPGLVAILCLTTRWFSQRRFPFISGLTGSLTMLGAALAALLLTLTVHHMGWRIAVLICGVAGFSLAIATIFIVKDYPIEEAKTYQKGKKFVFKREFVGLKMIFKRAQVWLNGLSSALTFCIFPAFFAMWAIPFFIDKYRSPQNIITPLVSAGFIGAGVGGPLLGYIATKIHRKKIIILISSLIGIGVSLIVIFISFSPKIMCVFTFLLGFVCSAYLLPYAIVEEQVEPQVKGKALGFTNMLSLGLGAPILQPLIGAALNEAQDPLEIPIKIFEKVLLVLPFALLLAFIVTLFIKEKKQS